MNAEDNYLEINRQSWNRRAEVHLGSDFYDVPAFLNGKNTLCSIEQNLLGDISGKTVLHLQCHFGLDAISLARLGAKVTGVDLSDTAIESARQLAAQTKTDASFICCDVYDLEKHCNTQFDMVFTTYGTIGWLPDMHRWAQLISKFLKPGGKLVFAEFHPVVWMFDNYFTKISYNYFKDQAIIETESGTYADRTANITQQYVSWNHSLGEVLGSLINNGLQLASFEEFDYSPYNCFNGTEEFEPGKYRIASLGNNIPMVYALTATKK